MNKRSFIKNSICATCGLAVAFGTRNLFGSLYRNLSAPPDDPNRFSREALHYVSTPRGIKCKLCPQACELKPGETGDCRTRENIDGKLYTIAYGNPCAVHIDPIEKKPLYHFLPASKAYSIATAGCNLACLNCQNWTISQESPRNTRNYDLFPAAVVTEAKKYQCRTIAYTYSEPIAFYEYTMDTCKIARIDGIKNLFISAGFINEQPLRELAQFLDAANIDLKSFSNDTYEMLNAGTLEPVLNTLKILRDEGVWLEITNLIVPSWTDNMQEIRKMCQWLFSNGFENTPLHFSRFHPMYKLKNLPPTPANTLDQARNIALGEGLNYVYVGNAPELGDENTICPNCKKIAIKRKGFSVTEINVRDGKCISCGSKIEGVWE